MNPPAVAITVAVCLLFVPGRASAQDEQHRYQAGVHVGGAVSGEFDGTDVGIGGRLSWHPSGWLGADAEITFYPSDFADQPAFSGNRIEGLFGATIGPRLAAIRPFARVRPGFVRFAEAPEPFACILIFPPPLACRLASGATLFALDVGGGFELYPNDRTFARIDVGDRMLKYPPPVIDGGGTVRGDAFFGHDFRFQLGGGFRF